MSDELILLIEDSRGVPAGIAALLSRLRTRQYVMVESHTLADGIKELKDARFAAIILELTLPDAHSLPAFLRLQSKAQTVPIIVMVDRAQEDLGIEATRRGALDYLLKEEISAPRCSTKCCASRSNARIRYSRCAPPRRAIARCSKAPPPASTRRPVMTG